VSRAQSLIHSFFFAGASHPDLSKGMDDEHCVKTGCSDEFVTGNYGVRTNPRKEYEIATGRCACPAEDMLDKKREKKVRVVRRIEVLKQLKVARKAGLSEDEILAVVHPPPACFNLLQMSVRCTPSDPCSLALSRLSPIDPLYASRCFTPDPCSRYRILSIAIYPSKTYSSRLVTHPPFSTILATGGLEGQRVGQVYNAILRRFPLDVYGKFAAGGNLYATTIHVLVSAVVKIARVMNLPPGLELFRGLGGLMDLPDSFRLADANGRLGYTEFGFLSTTSDKSVAVEVPCTPA
jgi:hypothetical protein